MRDGNEPTARVRWGAACLAAAALSGAAAGAESADRGEYAKDFAALTARLDANYAFFDAKGIRPDWAATKKRLAGEAKRCRTDTQFLGIVVDTLRCLRDGHAGVMKTEAKFPEREREYYSGFSFMPASNNRVVVMHPPRDYVGKMKTGTVVLTINGKPARAVLEACAKKAWAEGGFFSSPQRARLFEYRVPLRGKIRQRHVIAYLDGKRKRMEILTALTQARGWPRLYNIPAGLKQVGRSFWYAGLTGGAGYMYLRRVDASIVPGIAEARKALPDAKGWIVDLRGNSGGGYDATLIRAIKEMPRPVAAIIDAGCISAGETLARDFARFAGARLFGTRSAGSSSAKEYFTLPSGIATVRFSLRSRWRRDGKPIEHNGIDPDEIVEPDPDEMARGLNSAILRAEAHLKKHHPR